MPGRIQYNVACPCGGTVVLDARGFGRPQPCRSCKGTIIVAWGRDAKNTQSIPVVVRHVAGDGRPLPTTSPAAKGPPMKTQLLPGSKFFDCVCGERNLLVGTGPGTTVVCPGCDRVHQLEAATPPAAAASAPTAPAPRSAAPAPPAPPPAPPPPPAPTRTLRMGEFLCRCGEILPPRTSRTGRDFECKACGRKGHVAASQDAKGQPRIEPVFTFEPASTPLPAPPAARAPAPAGAAAVWTCPCGRQVPATAALAGKASSCPACGREIRLETHRAPHSTMTVMKPVFAKPQDGGAPEKPAP